MALSDTPHLERAFARNVRALGERDPGLVERIGWPAAGDHVLLRPGQPARYRVGLEAVPLALDDATCRARIDEALAGRAADVGVLLLGVGGGELLAALLADGRVGQVVAWERDPWLLRLVLGHLELADALGAGRLRLRLGVDLIDEIDGDPGRAVVEHPLLSQVYRTERALLAGGLGERRALLRAGTLFVDDLAAALADEGFAVFTHDTERIAREELAYTMRRWRPSLVAAINYTHGLAEFCAEHDCDLLCWEIDPTTSGLRPVEGPAERAFVFSYRRANVDEFRDAGFARVRYAPLAASPARRHPVALSDEQRRRYAAPVSHVGASMAAEAVRYRQRFLARHAAWLAGGGEEPPDAGHAAERLAGVLTAQRADLADYRVPALLDGAFGAFLAAADAGDDPEDPRMLVAEIAASEKRLTYVANLGPLGAVVWGDAGWRPATAGGARWSGRFAHHGAELTRIYNASSINVDIGRLYQSDIVTMRVFDVLACGGFLLAEHSDALGELFAVGTEIESYRTLGELLDKARWYLARPDAREAIAGRGLAAVTERHTIGQRVRWMLGEMGASGSEGTRGLIGGWRGDAGQRVR